jgi:hypothetical protein
VIKGEKNRAIKENNGAIVNVSLSVRDMIVLDRLFFQLVSQFILAHQSMPDKNNNLVPCPHCGAEIKIKSAACPYCGSDKETGWSSDAYLDGLYIPEHMDESSYEEIRQNEFGGRGQHYGLMKRFVLVLTAFFLLIVIITGVFLVLR